MLMVHVDQRHHMCVQQEKQQQHPIHVTVQAEQHLLDQIVLEHANAHLEVVSLTPQLQAVDQAPHAHVRPVKDLPLITVIVLEMDM